jgi:flagellar hook-associated protein 3 FlgL
MSAISTLAQQSLFLQTIGQLQTQANTLESQVSTGEQSSNLEGYGATAGELSNLQDQISQDQGYVSTINTVQQNIQESSTALGSIESAVQGLVSGLPESAYNTSPNTIQETAGQLLQEVGDFLNTQGPNGYIFSGSLTNTAPYDPSGLPNPGSLTTSVSGAPPNGYYAGNDTAQSATVDNNLTLQYGVTADNPAIENIVRALNFLANLPAGSPSSTSATDQANVTQAQQLLQQGVTGLQSVIGKLASQTGELTSIQQNQQNAINLAQSSLTSTEAVNPATVISQLNQLETNMQASYTTISDLQKMSLVNFLGTTSS